MSDSNKAHFLNSQYLYVILNLKKKVIVEAWFVIVFLRFPYISYYIYCVQYCALLDKFWRISLYLTDDAIAQL